MPATLGGERVGLLRGSDRRSELLERAHAAFDVALREVPTEHLWFLHAALEKRQVARVVRGSWGGPEGLTCPLSALVCGAAPANDDEAREAAIRAEDLLRSHGYCARDFYGPWDAGLIPGWRLLRRVDGEITRRLMQRARRSASRPTESA
jgi:hypothetical protein